MTRTGHRTHAMESNMDWKFNPNIKTGQQSQFAFIIVTFYNLYKNELLYCYPLTVLKYFKDISCTQYSNNLKVNFQ